MSRARRLRLPRSRLKSVAQPSNGDDVTRVGGIGLDLGAQPADVHVDESTITEVVIAPHLVEQGLSAEHSTGVLAELDEQTELCLGEVELDPRPQHLSLIGNDLEISEHELRVSRAHRADAPEEGTDSSR